MCDGVEDFGEGDDFLELGFLAGDVLGIYGGYSRDIDRSIIAFWGVLRKKGSVGLLCKQLVVVCTRRCAEGFVLFVEDGAELV